VWGWLCRWLRLCVVRRLRLETRVRRCRLHTAGTNLLPRLRCRVLVLLALRGRCRLLVLRLQRRLTVLLLWRGVVLGSVLGSVLRGGVRRLLWGLLELGALGFRHLG